MIKNMKYFVAAILAMSLIFSLAACGGNDSAAADAEASVEERTVPAEPDTVKEVLPEADTSSTGDVLIGSWKDISDPALLANISKIDTGYQYEDNEGVYAATFESGKLKVSVSEDAADFAEAYVNPETGHLLVLYQGGVSEFEKK